jgi:hypothetical protein
MPDHVDVIDRDGGRDYIVKLECVGCPVRVWTSPEKAEWLHPPPNNSLVSVSFGVKKASFANTNQLLNFVMSEFNNALLLNGQPIFPLSPMPLHINAVQVPTEMELNVVRFEDEEALEPNKPGRMVLPLRYQQTIFRAEEAGFLWLQFNVTGLPWGEKPEPVIMGQKIVQIKLRKDYDEGFEYDENLGGKYILSMEDVQLVEAKDKLQPPRMKCGKLAMMQTTFDPSEWDEYGKFGTWSRTWNFLAGRVHLGEHALLLPLLALLVASLVMARRLFLQRQQAKSGTDSDAETLLGRDAPPPYADIPVIKIEEYD